MVASGGRHAKGLEPELVATLDPPSQQGTAMITLEERDALMKLPALPPSRPREVASFDSIDFGG
jgi:hypothetical protein